MIIFDGFIWLWSHFGWLNIIMVFAIIYLGRRKPARSTMMWIMVMALLPFVGFAFYLMMGLDRRRNKMFRKKGESDHAIQQLIAYQQSELVAGKDPFLGSDFEQYRDLVCINLNMDEGVFTDGNSCRLFFDGRDKFQALFEDLDHAKRTIEIQYYIVRSDGLGRQLMDHMLAAAKRGVRVRFLVDAVGGRKLKDADANRMRDAGIEMAVFFPSFFKHINPRINYRNHRKLVTIDDYIGYIGGFNVGDEYLGESEKFGYWRDTHMRIEGPAVLDLKIRILQDWFYASGEDPVKEPSFRIPKESSGSVAMQLVTSGPDTNFPNIKYAMIEMIHTAQKAIYIQSPYLIPDRTMMDALALARLRDVEVNVMIPNKPDHPFTLSANMSYAGELIQLGAHVYRYENGFLHAKTMVVDDAVSFIGSANLDERSFSLNFEASEMVYSREVNRTMCLQFQRDVKESTLLTPEIFRRRPMIEKLKEPIARLFSPIL